MRIIHRVPAIVLGGKEEKIQKDESSQGEKFAYSRRQSKKNELGGLELTSTGQTLVSCLLLQVGWL